MQIWFAQSATSHYTQFCNCDYARGFHLCVDCASTEATLLNAQLTLGTVKLASKRLCCDVGCSEKLTTETRRKSLTSRGRESRERRQRSRSTMASISNNGRDFDSCPLWDPPPPPDVANTTHFWRSYARTTKGTVINLSSGVCKPPKRVSRLRCQMSFKSEIFSSFRKSTRGFQNEIGLRCMRRLDYDMCQYFSYIYYILKPLY